MTTRSNSQKIEIQARGSEVTKPKAKKVATRKGPSESGSRSNTMPEAENAKQNNSTLHTLDETLLKGANDTKNDKDSNNPEILQMQTESTRKDTPQEANITSPQNTPQEEKSQGLSDNVRGLPQRKVLYDTAQDIHSNKPIETTTDITRRRKESGPPRYTSVDTAPFYVIAIYEPTDDQDSRKDINKIQLGKMLHRENFEKCNEIIKIGFRRCRIKTNTYTTANKIVQEQSLAKYNIRTYIPLNYISTEAYIKGVPPDLTIDDIKKGLQQGCVTLHVT